MQKYGVVILAVFCLALSALAIPRAVYKRTPNMGENDDFPMKMRQIMAPEGGDKLLSRRCPVTASIQMPAIGEWSMLTDGKKECDYGGAFGKWGSCQEEGKGASMVLYAPGVQWVQVDLKTSQVVNAVCVWRYSFWEYAYRDVIVQLSDDADFIDGVTTVFNNDHDNSAGLGAGEDKEYMDDFCGNPVAVPSVRARHVRIYSNGRYKENGDIWPYNCCTEIEVFGGEPVSDKKVRIAVENPKPVFK